MLGWNATPWLAIEAGRMKNPLFMVNAMVFDHDIVFEGAQEKLKFTMGDTTLFGNVGQYIYMGKGVGSNNDSTTTQRQSMVLAFQGGLEQAFNSSTSAKAAIGSYVYTGKNTTSGTGGIIAGTTSGNFNPTTGDAISTGSPVNDISIVDALGEVNYMVSNNVGIRPYAEYAYNTRGSDRQTASGIAGSNDDSAWLVGFSVASAKDFKSFQSKKMFAGDWNVNLWYQDVGVYALDPNSVDTDIFDGRVNMKGTSLKAQYNVQDNVMLNFTGGWGTRKNAQYATAAGAKVDLNGDVKSVDVYQFDVTYKF
jgi:hypothetical protein